MHLTRESGKPFVIPVFIPHAGCPHRCVFCNQSATTGRTDPFPSPDRIKETIARFLSYRRQKDLFAEIAFFGGNFLGLPRQRIEQLLALSQEYILQGQVQGIRFSTRPDSIDTKRLELIAPYGVTTVELGVQSMLDEVLAQSRRGHRAQDITAAVGMLRQKTDYTLGLQMMIGLPGDTPAGALATAHRLAQWSPDFVRIYPTLVLKGSRLAQWHARGRYTPLTLDAAVSQTKALYALFAGKGIRVIRMGLQPTKELSPQEDVLAGPFHPAFGELVLAALWLDALETHFNREGIDQGVVTLKIHPKSVSRVKGQKSVNVDQLRAKFALSRVDVVQEAHLPLDTVLVNGKACTFLASV